MTWWNALMVVYVLAITIMACGPAVHDVWRLRDDNQA